MATLFDFDENGIKFQDFQNLRGAIEAAWKTALGVNLNLSPTTPDGHHVDLECRVIRSVTELLQEIVSNLNRNTARGQYLDFLAAFVGITRHQGESDQSLRNRMVKAAVGGYATYDGMLTYLQNAIDVGVSLAINDDSKSVDGMPGHSFRLTVPSGYTYNGMAIGTDTCNNHIAQEIWTCKPAGIRSSGNSNGTAVDKSGNEHTVYFSVPQSVSIDMDITLSAYSEEAFPASGIDDVRNAIVAWASTEYKPGKDVIPQRICVPVYSVPGIENATIKVRRHGETTWQTTPIRISSEQSAIVSFENVNVVKD